MAKSKPYFRGLSEKEYKRQEAIANIKAKRLAEKMKKLKEQEQEQEAPQQ